LQIKKQDRIKQITQSIIGLPTLPTVITQMIGLIENPGTSAKEVSQLISTDQALTAKILKLANSAFYGFPRGISTVNQAVVVLGFETVKSLGLSISVLERFAVEEIKSSFDRQKFWEHSISCGVAARLLARKFNYQLRGEAFSCGILHDVGKLILSQYFADEFNQILLMSEEEYIHISKAEERVLGVTHTDIGRWLAEKWNLPSSLISAIAHHHKPSNSSANDTQLSSLIHLADILCRREEIGDGGGPSSPSLDPSALSAIGMCDEPNIAMQNLYSLGQVLHTEMEKADIFNNIASGRV
tara:strand:- start:466 stop:1362 length:897 start_codon:yes stop_codon:yes gene_type:complete